MRDTFTIDKTWINEYILRFSKQYIRMMNSYNIDITEKIKAYNEFRVRTNTLRQLNLIDENKEQKLNNWAKNNLQKIK